MARLPIDLLRQSLRNNIERVAQIHHRLTVIHAFRDGNGRTSRCFANMMMLKRDIAPIFFSGDKKRDYKAALNDADTKGSFDHLYQCFFQSLIKAFATLSDYQIKKTSPTKQLPNKSGSSLVGIFTL